MASRHYGSLRVRYAYHLAVLHSARARVVFVDLDVEFTSPAAMPVDVAVARVEEVEGFTGDQLESTPRRDVPRSWQRIVARVPGVPPNTARPFRTE